MHKTKANMAQESFLESKSLNTKKK